MELTELERAREREIYNRAKECGGTIQIITKGDYNDADYSYAVAEFTPEEFLERGIYKHYLVIKDLKERNIRLEDAGYGDDRPTYGDPEEIEYLYEMDMLPLGDTAGDCGIHTVTSVKLQILLDINDIIS